VYTSDLHSGKSAEGTDASVYVELIGNNDEVSERIWLTKEKSISKNRNLFEPGNCDEFLIRTTKLNRLGKLKIGHDNSGFASGWYLNYVEIISKSDGQKYNFPCSRWLSKDEEDKKIERVLLAAENTGRDSKLKISVKHQDETDSDASIPSSSEFFVSNFLSVKFLNR